MERGSKRKAAAMASPSADPRSAKRARTPPAGSMSRTDVRDTGLHFIEQLKRAVDKTGRPIAGHFLELPEKSEYPDYYEMIEVPMALNTLIAKLNGEEYEDMSAFESDVKRMINNAKKYNDNKSEVYADAERIRKNTFNFMAKFNPAYGDRGHIATATPLPDKAPTGGEDGKKLRLTLNKVERTPSQPAVERVQKAASASRRPSRSQSITANNPTPAQETASSPSENRFKGMSFQDAQGAIVEELIRYVDPSDEEGLEIFTPFHSLPNRQEVPDYYQVIQQPTSLRGILKRTVGNHGRQGKTGITDFKTWDDFEKAVTRIWENARAYNEDGSEIFDLAAEFENVFKTIFAEAKAVVESPPTTIKLNVGGRTNSASGMKIKLGNGSAKDSPTPTPSALPSNGMSVDAEALQRQRAHVQAGINGGLSNTTMTNGSPAPKVETPGINGINGPPTNGYVSATPAANSTMPLPTPAVNGHAAPVQPAYYAPPPPPPQENKWRPEGKTAADALYEMIHISTHPDLNSIKSYPINIQPHPRLAHQSITTSIPGVHTYLRMAPALAPSLGPGGRPFKIFVNLNGQRVQSTATPASMNDQRRPVFDLRLHPGVNRIEFEIAAVPAAVDSAAKTNGASPTPSTPQGLEVERCHVYVNLLR